MMYGPAQGTPSRHRDQAGGRQVTLHVPTWKASRGPGGAAFRQLKWSRDSPAEDPAWPRTSLGGKRRGPPAPGGRAALPRRPRSSQAVLLPLSATLSSLRSHSRTSVWLPELQPPDPPPPRPGAGAPCKVAAPRSHNRPSVWASLKPLGTWAAPLDWPLCSPPSVPHVSDQQVPGWKDLVPLGGVSPEAPRAQQTLSPLLQKRTSREWPPRAESQRVKSPAWEATEPWPQLLDSASRAQEQTEAACGGVGVSGRP